MSLEIRSLLTKFGADTSSFTSGTAQVKASLNSLNTDFYKNKAVMKETQKEITSLAKEQKTLNTAIKSGTATKEQIEQFEKNKTAIDKLTVKLGGLKTTEQELKSKIGTTTSEFKDQTAQIDKTKTSIAGLGTALKLAITGYTGKKLYEALIGSNAEMEQYETSFGVMLGDIEQAKTLMDDLVSFSSVTPYTLEDVVPEANLLLSYGVQYENLLDTMTKLGDLSQGNAEKFDRITLAYGQMLAKGKVTGEELRQMTEAGVPLMQTLADTIGVTTAEYSEMQEAGEVSIDVLNQGITALTTGTGKFAGMMEKQSQTMNGLISTMQDNLQQVGRDVGLEVFKEVKVVIDDILTDLKQAQADGTLAENAERIGKAIAGVTEFLWDNRKAIVSLTGALAAYKIGMSIGSLLKTFALAIKAVRVATDTATTSQVAYNTALSANPIGVVIGLLGALSAAIGLYVWQTDKATDKTDEYTQSMERAKETAQDMVNESEVEISTLEMKAEKYEELRKTQNRTEEQEKALKSLANDLQGYMPNTISLIDAETGAYSSLAGQIDLVVSKMRAKALLESKETVYKEALKQNQELGFESEKDFKNAEWGLNYWESNSHSSNLGVNAVKQKIKEDLQKNYDTAMSNREIIEDYESKYADMLAMGADDTNTSSGTTENIPTDFETFVAELKKKKNVNMVSDDEYYSQLEQALTEGGYSKLGDYNSYWSEVLNRSSSSSGSSSSSSSTADRTSEADDALASDKEYLDNKKSLLTEYLKDTLEEKQDAIQAEIDMKAGLKEQTIDNINAELEAQEKLFDEKVSAIDKEIEARKRLKESQDSADEIQALQDQLKYSNGGQLDDFSRAELQKKISSLQEEKADTEWQWQKEDEKEQLQAEYDAMKEKAEERIETVEKQYEEFEKLANQRMTKIQTEYDNSTTNLNACFDMLNGTTSTYDALMAQTQEQLSNSYNKMRLAVSMINSQMASLQSQASSIQTNYNSTTNTNTFTYANPNLSENQIARKIIDSLGGID